MTDNAARSLDLPTPSAERLAAEVEGLAKLTRPDRPHTRRAFSDEDRAARAWLSARMAEAGLDVEHAAAAAEAVGIPYRRLTSSASHDADHIARLCPVGLLFVPCRDGRSHGPGEWAEPAHLAAGTRVLLELLLRLDAALPPP